MITDAIRANRPSVRYNALAAAIIVEERDVENEYESRTDSELSSTTSYRRDKTIEGKKKKRLPSFRALSIFSSVIRRAKVTSRGL